MKHVDLLRGIYGCRTDAGLAEVLGLSRPSVSRYRRLGLPESVRGRLVCRLLEEGREIPVGLRVPQHPSEVDMRSTMVPGQGERNFANRDYQ